jgi:flagellar L-ring protein precursor FlgH
MIRTSRALLAFVAGLCAIAPLMSAEADAPAEPRSLFSDRRAHIAGDILTVLVSEVASVSQQAQTRLSKGESANANLLQRDGEIQLANVGFDSRFDGGGRMERAGSLLARLTVRIDAIDANGNFLVSGEQLIVLNNEKQRILLSGIVRPDDIASDNTIPSWRVAGANIQLVGKGMLTKKARPGLLTWLLSLFGQ